MEQVCGDELRATSGEELCAACLVRGRLLSTLAPDHRRYYTRILNDVRVDGSGLELRVCWECVSVLRRSLAFCERAKMSYQMLQAYNFKNTDTCPDISRPPRLRLHVAMSVDVPPAPARDVSDPRDDDVKGERQGSHQNDDEEEHLKLEEVQMPAVKSESDSEPAWASRGAVKRETEPSAPEGDCLFPSDDSDDLAQLECEVNAFIRGEKNKKLRKKKGDKENKSVKKVIKRLKVKKKEEVGSKRPLKKRAEEKIRTVEMSYEEMLAERRRDAQREPYARADFKCESCLVGFSYRRSYAEHMDTRHDPSRGDYSCPVCKSVIATVESFTAHYKRHLRRYECAACGKRTMDRKVMTQHYRSAHDTTAKEYKCHCGHASRSLDAHRYHKDTHKARVECVECDKTFSHRAGLMNHRLSVHKLKNMFPCTLCEKVFRWKASLKKHLERHERKFRPPADAPYCEPCGVSFSSACTYQRHMRSSLKHVSESELRFVCADCGRKFSNKTKLRDHIEEKHLHKTYQCHICQKPSKNRVCLDQHVRNVHKGRPNNKMCHHCGKGFPTKVQLESHIRSHTGERPFICEFCPTTFSQQSNLYKHNRQVHMNIKAKRYPPPCRKRRERAPAVPAEHPPAPAPHHDPYQLCARYDAPKLDDAIVSM